MSVEKLLAELSSGSEGAVKGAFGGLQIPERYSRFEGGANRGATSGISQASNGETTIKSH